MQLHYRLTTEKSTKPKKIPPPVEFISWIHFKFSLSVGIDQDFQKDFSFEADLAGVTAHTMFEALVGDLRLYTRVTNAAAHCRMVVTLKKT